MTIVPEKVFIYEGDLIDRYQVEKFLGEGTFGIVVKAQDTHSGTSIALKIMKFWELMPEERKTFGQRFEREYTCGQIDSPYLVRSLDKGEHRGNPYMVMEFCPGGSLEKIVANYTSYDEVDHLALQCLMGLKALHENGVIHRDLKPVNILMDAEGNAKLTDFGIAGFQNARMTRRNFLGHAEAVFGTYAYMPPEQLNQKISFKAMSPATDLFSFGATFYEILTGRLPFGLLESEDHIGPYVLRANKGQWDDARKYLPDIPAHWIEIFEKSLHHDYKKRAQSTNELLEMLNASDHIHAEQIHFDHHIVGLEVMHGDEPGRIYNLSRQADLTGDTIYVGWYNPEWPNANHIGIVEHHTSYISRFHATIYRDRVRRKWLISDGQTRMDVTNGQYRPSTNGTLVNGIEAGQQGVELHIGDIITLGDTTLKVIVKNR
ncbi:protein kinase domain-containing protein [Thermaurantimonas sp.]|uniref:protein kinase domain-containing protein n=1 Tax=Thermaurantimonas sp. TaxID=2681568 RepID=UPI00391BC7D1